MLTAALSALTLAVGVNGSTLAKSAIDIVAPNAAAAVPPAAPTTAKPTSYCVKETMTGTRIATKICRTRAEWLSRGMDPLEKN